ncbi:MAG: hypothetical protein IT367_04040 [Candidatus Hydrogenedentes bacterium]|nr:hypothetical protein [Candidatus Hydrogenedentota bacterium]
MNASRATFKVAIAIFVALVLLTFALTGMAAHYGRAWSVRAYDENLRQDIRALAAKEQYGAIERIALSVLRVSPEYEATIREETAAYLYILPELSAMLRGELPAGS